MEAFAQRWAAMFERLRRNGPRDLWACGPLLTEEIQSILPGYGTHSSPAYSIPSEDVQRVVEVVHERTLHVEDVLRGMLERKFFVAPQYSSEAARTMVEAMRNALLLSVREYVLLSTSNTFDFSAGLFRNRPTSETVSNAKRVNSLEVSTANRSKRVNSLEVSTADSA